MPYALAAHLETILPSQLRRPRLALTSERIATPDDDFLDLCWHRPLPGRPMLAILCHGLEGTATSHYNLGMAGALATRLGYHALLWSYRSCSGEMNRQRRFYHLGEIEDLGTVIAHAQEKGYGDIVLVGFSAGASVVLNYAGRLGAVAQVRAVAAVSAPLSLAGAAKRMETPGSVFYNRRFCRQLIAKVQAKERLMPGQMPNLDLLAGVETLRRFDDLVTAPLHGFMDSADYYAQCSAIRWLPTITVPTLILTARNDPFFEASCYPEELLEGRYPWVRANYPKRGGHVGFAEGSVFAGPYASERIVGDWLAGL